MRVSVTDAKAQLTDLVRRAEAGEEVILTRHDRPVIQFKPVRAPLTREERKRVLLKVRAAVAAKGLSPGPDAAHSADFLYDENGLPK